MPFRLMSPNVLKLTLREYEQRLHRHKCGVKDTAEPWRQEPI